MALVTTTLSSACGVNDKSIVVASATSVAAGRVVLIDGEKMQVTKDYSSGTTIPVLRGRDGTAQVAHPASANATHGDAIDFQQPLAGGNATQYAAPLVLDVKSYSAAGAIDLPTGRSLAVRVINGTGALAMTIAAPTKDMDGAIMVIASGGAAAHTLTFSGGLSGAGTSYDVVTINASAPASMIVVACNALWTCPFGPAMGGTVTNLIGSVA